MTRNKNKQVPTRHCKESQIADRQAQEPSQISRKVKINTEKRFKTNTAPGLEKE
jgi:hypothetical protein